MLPLLPVLSVMVTIGYSLIDDSDLNCTVIENGEHVYHPSAVSCSNVLSDESCELIFPLEDSKFPEPGDATPRPPNCYRPLDTTHPRRFKGLAVSFCPKTCGFCCQTDEFQRKVQLIW